MKTANDSPSGESLGKYLHRKRCLEGLFIVKSWNLWNLWSTLPTPQAYILLLNVLIFSSGVDDRKEGKKKKTPPYLNYQIFRLLTRISPDLRLWEVLPAKADDWDCNLTGPAPRARSREAWPKEKKITQEPQRGTCATPWEQESCSLSPAPELQAQFLSKQESVYSGTATVISDPGPCLAALVAAAEPPWPSAHAWKMSPTPIKGSPLGQDEARMYSETFRSA